MALQGGRKKRKVVSSGRQGGEWRQLRLRLRATGRWVLGEIESEVETQGQRTGERERAEEGALVGQCACALVFVVLTFV